mmetsp:Transcript_77087/g.195666  ORF Transcript_77087/g.195666 Transcript_77087/m.195666 type:complete len:303 (-) Transcript_77087:51-959(-)
MAKVNHEITVKQWEEMEKWEKIDVSALAVSSVKGFVMRRPIVTGFWAFGMLLAVFACGLPVDEAAQEAYSLMLQHAEVVDSRELGRSEVELKTLEDSYYSLRGWFGACDDSCKQAEDKVQMARVEVARARARRDQALAEARREVGIWSTFGVQDVRRSFWAAVQSGKDFAARCTMYDAIFMSMGRDETFTTMAIKLVLQYVINLTMGLVGAFFYFVYNVYTLVMSYGATVLSGFAFFLLTLVAGVAMISSYLGMIYGVVAGGGMLMLQHAVRQAAIESSQKDQMKALGQAKKSRAPAPKCPV